MDVGPHSPVNPPPPPANNLADFIVVDGVLCCSIVRDAKANSVVSFTSPSPQRHSSLYACVYHSVSPFGTRAGHLRRVQVALLALAIRSGRQP
jgi:hypothetical protein